MASRPVPPDRTLPHSKAAEQAVLGAVLFDQRAIGQVLELIDPASFYAPQHQEIFEAVVDLYETSKSVDVVTLGERLKAKGKLDAVGGMAYLAELGESVPTTTHAIEYAETVRSKALLRRLVDVAGEITADALAGTDDAQAILDRAESRIFEVAERTVTGGPLPIKAFLHDSFEYIDTLHKSSRAVTGLPTGFTDLDIMMTGLQPSDLIIIAARPSMGKTSLALSIARHVGVKEGKSIAFFSMEMAKQQLVLRLLSAQARMNLRQLQTGSFGEERYASLVQASGTLSEAPIYIDDTPGLSVLDVRTKARRLAAQGKLDLVILDYLQLMHERRPMENRQQEISKISRSLKQLARELNVPVVALSQLSRAVESRPDNRPQLADLRESGAIEQDADVVLLLFRQEYYERQKGGDEAVSPDAKGMAEVIVAKQRNGPTGVVDLAFVGGEVRFENLSKREM